MTVTSAGDERTGGSSSGAGPWSVRVELGPRSYDAHIGDGLLAQLGGLVRGVAGDRTRAFVVADTGVPGAARGRVLEGLGAAGFRVSVCDVTPTEETKTLASLERVLAAIESSRHERPDPIVALGGGIVGDLAGFAGAVYRRGAPVVQCPTTLLAMVDAAVGGKTGVNLAVPGVEGPGGLRKNAVGAFHQPRTVVADTGTLASLPARVFRAGLAECIKHALLGADAGDAGLLEWTARALASPGGIAGPVLAELVARNVALKARVVSADEREEQPEGRARLNLGHTFGHAIETLPGLALPETGATSPLQHGESVALGLVAAAYAAVASGGADASVVAITESMLRSAGLPTRVRGLPSTREVLGAMRHDKKVVHDRLRLVLPTVAGRCRVVDGAADAWAEAGVEAIRAR